MSAANSWLLLETPRLRLRRFREGDLPIFMEYRNDPEVARYQGWDSVSLDAARIFIQEQAHAPLGVPGIGMQIAIESKATSLLIGDLYFRIQLEDARQAELGYTLSRAAQGQGLATEAVDAWLTHAFRAFELHRVTANLDVENQRSAALLERVGLRREGHYLQSAWFKGRWSDEYLYATLRSEWDARHNTPER